MSQELSVVSVALLDTHRLAVRDDFCNWLIRDAVDLRGQDFRFFSS
jgi:hypothetical protein